MSDFDEPFTPIAEIMAAQQHYAAIGSVAAEWADFEGKIDFLALKLAKFNQEKGACFTAQISGSDRKLNAYISIAKILGATDLSEDLEIFAKDTQKLAERRHRIIHDPWAVSLYGIPRRFETTARRKLRRQFIDVPTSDVSKCATDIRDHLERLDKLHERVLAAIPNIAL